MTTINQLGRDNPLAKFRVGQSVRFKNPTPQDGVVGSVGTIIHNSGVAYHVETGPSGGMVQCLEPELEPA